MLIFITIFTLQLSQFPTRDMLKVIDRYETGLKKLDFAASQVSIMQTELTRLQPLLKEASVQVDFMVERIEKDSLEVEEIEKVKYFV